MCASSWTAADGVLRTTPEWLQTLVVALFTLGVIRTTSTATGEEVQCNVARQNCVARIGCSMALHNYLVYCGQVMHGQTDVCPARCRKALVSLLSTEDREGEAFMECDCNGNGYCHTQKQRLEICSRDVLAAMKQLTDDTVDISCSLAELICRADTSCLAALQYFDMNCAKLQSGEKCTSRCNNSLGILLRQKKARKLRTCVCDGTETYPCRVVQQSIERLCYRKHRHHHNHTRCPHGSSRPPAERPIDDNSTRTIVDPSLPVGSQGHAMAGCNNVSSDGGSHCGGSSSSAAAVAAAASLLGIPHSRTCALSILVVSIALMYIQRQR